MDKILHTDEVFNGKEAVFKPISWSDMDISLLEMDEKYDVHNKIAIDDLHYRAYFSNEDGFTHRSDWLIVVKGELVEVAEKEAEAIRKSMERKLSKQLDAVRQKKSRRQIEGKPYLGGL